MKIVLPVHHFPPQYSAGAELYTYRLAKWLLKNGHRPEVVCIEAIDQGRPDSIMAMQDSYDGITVHRLKTDLLHAPERDRWFYDHPLLGEWFARYIQRAQPDLAHFQAGYLIGAAPLRAAAAAGLPTLLTLHDYWFLCPRITLQRGDGSLCDEIPSDPAGCDWCMKLASRRHRLVDQITRGLAGSLARSVALKDGRNEMTNRRAVLADALTVPKVVISPSHFLAGKFAPMLSPGQLRVSPYGLDRAAFQQRRPPSDGTLRIGFIGQIASHKGVHVLVSAFRLVQSRGRRVELHVFGGLNIYPNYAAQLRRFAGGDSRVHFRGRFETKLLAATLAGLDVTVTPSLWYDNSPLAIHESRAAGVPAVVSTLGGMPELITDEVDGLHVRPGDVQDLARQMQRLIDEPDLLPRLRAGVAANPPRDIQDEMRELMAVYERVIGAPEPEASHAV